MFCHVIYIFYSIGAGIGIAVPLLIKELTEDSNQTKVSALLPASPSFGCIALPFIITVSVSKYGLDGCFLILAALILNSIPIICIAKCRFRFHLPTKWRLRKRSKRYQMSQKQDSNDSVAVYKPKGLQEFYNESFLENLEPDTLQKVSDSDAGSKNKYEFIDILQPIIDAKRKMTTSETCGKKCFEDKLNHKNNCYKLENDFNNKLSEIITDVQQYEKNRKPFEESFSHMNVISEDLSKSTESLSSNKIQSLANGSGSSNKSLMESTETIKNDLEKMEKGDKNTNIPEDSPPLISATNTTFHVSSQSNQNWSNFPVEIKVHVVECTITTNAEFFENSFEQNAAKTGRKAYRRHSNSLISGCYDNIDFTQLLLNNKASSFQKHQLNSVSKMFLITEEDETEFDNRQASFRKGDIEAFKKNEHTSKSNNKIRNLRKMLNPPGMVVIYAFVTYELTLAVLLTMFADFARDTNDFSMSSNIVLLAFGIGGIVGQMFFTHWGNRLMAEGSHAAAAIIFMLNGLAVAGILWSANVSWMSGFYATLGFVESGILLILPRLVTDFVEAKNTMLLSCTCKCLSAISILCMPFAMGKHEICMMTPN